MSIICLLAVDVVFGKDHKRVQRVETNKQPREITVDERTIATVYTWPGYETELNLPNGEEIKQFGIGDGKLWVAECGVSAVADAGRPNICHLKPGFRNQSTNLNVITASGTYSFELVPATSTNPIDLKVFVTREHEKLFASNGTAEFASGAAMVPKAELEECGVHEQRAREQLARAEKDLSEARRRIAALVDPSSLAFDYVVKRGLFSRSTKALLFHDDAHTFLRSTGAPALYKTDGGKATQVDGDCRNGLCVFPLIERGYFTTVVGGKETKFERKHHA